MVRRTDVLASCVPAGLFRWRLGSPAPPLPAGQRSRMKRSFNCCVLCQRRPLRPCTCRCAARLTPLVLLRICRFYFPLRYAAEMAKVRGAGTVNLRAGMAERMRLALTALATAPRSGVLHLTPAPLPAAFPAVLVGRQFMEMTRSRVEGLIAAFPKLIDAKTEHTFVETESIRQVTLLLPPRARQGWQPVLRAPRPPLSARRRPAVDASSRAAGRCTAHARRATAFIA